MSTENKENITISVEDVENVVKESQKDLVNTINETKTTVDSFKLEIDGIKSQINTLAETKEDVPSETMENSKDKKAVDFLNFVRSRFKLDTFDPSTVGIMKDATMTTSNTYTVAPQYDLGIEGSITTQGLVRGVGQTKSLVSNVFHIPRVTGSAEAYIVGEGDATTQSQICPKDRSIPGVANTVKLALTKESIAFSNPYDLMSLVDSEVMTAMNKKEDIVAISGSAAGPIYGVYTDTEVLSFTQPLSGSGVAFSPRFQDFDAFEHTLDPTVRANGMYFLGTDHLAIIKSVNASGSKFIYDKQSDTVNGKKYLEFSSGVMTAATNSGSAMKHIAFGDPNKFWFADNGTVEVTSDIYTGAGTRTLYFYFTKLFSFGLRNPSAVVVWKLQA